ncbi:MAG TPA: efflux RND transporter periplasmic adaptor subunit [Clostridia bacterium]|nr:efflux RND transporter periplasmic adaptor subunit [Clostridia bacterium]
MSKTKKRVLIIIPIVLVAIAAGFSMWWFYFRGALDGGGEAVSVESVSVLAGLGGGLQSRYAGVVEPQATLEITLDSSRTIAETRVEVGDQVEDGTILFIYDTQELELNLEQMKLDTERIKDTIASTKNQISILEKQRDKVAASLQLEYTTQIKSYEAQVKQEEYNLKSKELELERQKDKIDNSIVRSTMEGMVQSINDTPAGGEMYYYEDQSQAYMVILSAGEFRVKGEINEQNIFNLASGSAVIIRSRLDESITWTGFVDYVDVENPVSGNNDHYYYGPVESDTVRSSKYPFYISLDSAQNLMLGQHVYIEPYLDQDAKEGIWLLEYYIVMEDGPFVWAVNQNRDRLEKRKVTLGDYDEIAMTYEIVEGLGPEDEIAWPTGELRAGMPVTREGFVPGGMDDGYYGEFEGDYYEGDYYDDGFPEGDYYEEGDYPDGAEYDPGPDGETVPITPQSDVPPALPASGSDVASPFDETAIIPEGTVPS